ncbi:MAG: hypothetical protein WCP03_03390 [Candidatus Saccharibacteria bacterium]
MAIFRSVNDPIFIEINQQIEDTCGNYLVSCRDRKGEKGHSISLLEKSENEYFKSIGHFALQDVIDMVYDGVPSLRETYDVGVDSVSIFGRTTSNSKVLAVTFDEESNNRVIKERREIVEIINLAAGGTYRVSDAITEKNKPHLSLARYFMDIPEDEINNAVDAIKTVLPNKFHVERATLYKPKRLYSRNA